MDIHAVGGDSARAGIAAGEEEFMELIPGLMSDVMPEVMKGLSPEHQKELAERHRDP